MCDFPTEISYGRPNNLISYSMTNISAKIWLCYFTVKWNFKFPNFCHYLVISQREWEILFVIQSLAICSGNRRLNNQSNWSSLVIHFSKGQTLCREHGLVTTTTFEVIIYPVLQKVTHNITVVDKCIPRPLKSLWFVPDGTVSI